MRVFLPLLFAGTLSVLSDAQPLRNKHVDNQVEQQHERDAEQLANDETEFWNRYLQDGVMSGTTTMDAGDPMVGTTADDPDQDDPPAVACTLELKVCSDGTAVGRTGPNCEFEPCPDGFCLLDVDICADGTEVFRDPDNNCDFGECPPEPDPDDACPIPGNGVCTTDFRPVVCGTNECVYSNACNAELSGFDVEADCTPAPTEDCPVPGEGICTMEFAPVVCGVNACEYSNGCEAGLAGFDAAADCTPAAVDDCPVPGEGMCTMEFAPVACGENGCEYSNTCEAGLAGFDVEADCTPVEASEECPVPGDGACTDEFAPVVCGDLACEYPNACTAELAGWDVATACSEPVICTADVQECPGGLFVSRVPPDCEFEPCPPVAPEIASAATAGPTEEDDVTTAPPEDDGSEAPLSVTDAPTESP